MVFNFEVFKEFLSDNLCIRSASLMLDEMPSLNSTSAHSGESKMWRDRGADSEGRKQLTKRE